MERLIEGNHTGDFMLAEPEPRMSRETITVTGGKFPAGAVLSLTAEGKYSTPAAAAGEHCVLWRGVDASTEDQQSVGIMRLASLKGNHLEWPEAITAEDKTAILSDMKDQLLIVNGES